MLTCQIAVKDRNGRPFLYFYVKYKTSRQISPSDKKDTLFFGDMPLGVSAMAATYGATPSRISRSQKRPAASSPRPWKAASGRLVAVCSRRERIEIRNQPVTHVAHVDTPAPKNTYLIIHRSSTHPFIAAPIIARPCDLNPHLVRVITDVLKSVPMSERLC